MFSSKAMAVVAAVGLLAGCGGHEKEARKTAESPVVRAGTVKAVEEELASEYVATGSVRARTSSVLAARVMGYVRELRVQAGETVKAGQVVAVIDAKEIDAAVKQAEAARAEAKQARPEVEHAIAGAQAQLELAQATHQRMANLFAQKSVTQQELDEATARLKLAQAGVNMGRAKLGQLEEKIRQADAAVAQAQVMQGYATVTAPFAGVVVERKAEPGMLAAPGMPLAVIEQAGGYRLEAAVEESRLGQLKQGTAVTVELDSVAEPFAGRIEEVVPALDPGSRTFLVKVGVAAGPQVKSGVFGRMKVKLGTRKALTVPEAAVASQGQVERVYVVESGVARGRLVSTGLKSGGKVEVLSGLTAGETVVAAVTPALADGVRIEGSAK